jgi:hypothetical protein
VEVFVFVAKGAGPVGAREHKPLELTTRALHRRRDPELAAASDMSLRFARARG